MLAKNEKDIMEAKKELINLYLIVKPQKLEEVFNILLILIKIFIIVRK